MKALIFAAGLGTRLKPITDTMPKALVPINGKPLLEHVICKLKDAGFDEIIINIHHFADQIIDFVKSKNYFDIRIEFSDERNELLETGGGIKKAQHFFNDEKPFLVHNVDIISNIDLKELYQSHLENDCLATLLVSDRKTSRYLLFNEANTLEGWINISTGTTKPEGKSLQLEALKKYAFSGIHIISPKIFKKMEGKWDGKFSIIDFYLDAIAKENIIGFIDPNLKMIDVGKLDSLKEAELLYSNL